MPMHGMKKKGYAKGGMKKKGYAKGGATTKRKMMMGLIHLLKHFLFAHIM